ncbi:MAG: nucleotidyltransferase family protein [Bacteroidota bacterium]
MSSKRTLLILAAGMGNRYGGLKQIDRFGPNGEALIDYTMYDAIRAGFNKIVFLIREDFEKAFRKRFEPQLNDQNVEIQYAYQHIYKQKYPMSVKRTKPWGTGEAVLACRDAIDEPFAVVNADDFYGISAMQTLDDFLGGLSENSEGNFAMVAYYLKATLSRYGKVARGIIQTDDNDHLVDIHEYKNIQYDSNGYITGESAMTGKQKYFSPDTMVSMNLWGFTPDIFDHLEQLFSEFLQDYGDSVSAEFYLPEAVSQMLAKKQATTKVFRTRGNWFGVTYREDKQIAIREIRAMIDAGKYPQVLWNNMATTKYSSDL